MASTGKKHGRSSDGDDSEQSAKQKAYNAGRTMDQHNIPTYTHAQLEQLAADPSLAPTVFTEIDSDDVKRIDDAYQDSSLLRVATSIAINGLLSGGILFERAQGVFPKEFESQALQQAWSDWLRDLILSLWKYGFALCLKEYDPQLLGVPRVLNLDQLKIRFHEDPYGHRFYAAYARVDQDHDAMLFAGGALSTVSPYTQEIPVRGVFVCEWDKPARSGQLRSLIKSCLPDIGVYNCNVDYYLAAARRLSNPPIVTQFVAPDYSMEQETYMVQFEPIGRVQNGPVTLAKPKPKDDKANEEIKQKACNMDVSPDPGITTSSILRSHYAPLANRVRTIDLPPNRQVARQDLPSIGVDIHNHRVELEERISAVFGVPRSMFAESQRSRTGSVENEMMFMQSQRDLKQRVLPFCYKMYNMIYGELHLLRSIADTTSLGTTPAFERNEVSITLPGVPPIESMMMLWQSGVLKYDATRQILKSAYGLPISFFNEMPALTLQEINGIKDTPIETKTSSNVSSKSNKTTPKTKSQSAKKKTENTVTKIPRTGFQSEYDKTQRKVNKPLLRPDSSKQKSSK